jgi:pimeloyl-ACP methyl ester carboxylesterase
MIESSYQYSSGKNREKMPPKNQMKFYTHLPEAQLNFTQDFHKTHSQKTLQVDRDTWRYYDSETQGPVLLLLHGGFADFSMWIHQITAFETGFRVIAPTCPALSNPTAQTYVDGLTAILDAEGVERLNLMGYSEGGLIAQCFLRVQRQRIDKAILAHTFYPTQDNKYYKNNFNVFRILPAPLTEWLFRNFAQPDKEESEAETAWKAWFLAYFESLKANLTKPIIITHIDLMMDFVRHYEFHLDDLKDWDGKLLITVSADDVVLRYYEGMKALYPMAETYVFDAGLGAHSIALISPDTFNRRILEFLKD